MAYEHLTRSAAEIARKSDAERLAWLQDQHWVPYTRAIECEKRLTAVLEQPRRKRMRNMLIVGPTNNGKSTIIERFCRRYPRTASPDGGHQIIPILPVDVPDGPFVRSLLAAILRELDLDGFASRTSTVMLTIVLQALKQAGTRMLVLDDIQNILDGRKDQTKQLLNLMRYLNNVLMISIVAVGTKDALKVMQRDSQTANRFRPFFLPRWGHDEDEEDDCRLLDSFDSVLPFPEPSNLSEPAKKKRILKLSDGLIGEIWTVLQLWGALAIEAGDPCLDLRHLSHIEYEAPSTERYARMAHSEGVLARLG